MPPFLLLDWSAGTPEENLALDEALLLEREEAARRAGDGGASEVLRFWESGTYFVAIGAAGRLAEEVDAEACRARGFPVLRRHSGGGTVLQGPGCLNFSLVLSTECRPSLCDVTRSYREILQATAAGLSLPGIEFRGTSDLALGEKKFSGNAQRRIGRSVLHHGTILHAFDLARISEVMPEPERRPEYRGGRRHEEFLTNLPLPGGEIRARLAAAWGAREPYPQPLPPVARLVAEKYGNRAWTERL
ncbi:MAG: lipoate--protein ligase family protein [Thermoanaerobaculia bacterium]